MGYIYRNIDDAVEKTISLRAFEQPDPDQEIYDRLYHNVYTDLFPALKGRGLSLVREVWDYIPSS
jgi:hypothetical protein